MSAEGWWQAAAQQRAFRAVLDGFARPGTLVCARHSGTDALRMLLSVVLDESVSLADPGGLLDADVRRLLLAPSAPIDSARFVVLDGRLAPEASLQLALGTLESPELGATLVLVVDALGEDAAACGAPGLPLSLQGPGVAGRRGLVVAGLDERWLTRRAAWGASFPLGIDLVLVCPHALVALPRTTRIATQGD
jgi:alpha-D-ribose 1-methylphosphonate 5-triphosphate synthase subunit PhnH